MNFDRWNWLQSWRSFYFEHLYNLCKDLRLTLNTKENIAKVEGVIRNHLNMILFCKSGSNPQKIEFKIYTEECYLYIKALNLYTELIIGHELIVPYIFLCEKTSWCDPDTQITYVI